MKNLTKKERFENVLAELKGVKGLDVISSYYYDHKNLYAYARCRSLLWCNKSRL